MTEYDVIIELPAADDLHDILSYITDILKEPVTAKRIYFSIKEQIEALRYSPLRNRIVPDEPYAKRGVRKLLSENYIAFYAVDESKLEVHVLRVLYNRREWRNVL